MTFNIVLWVWEVILNTSNSYLGASKTIIIFVVVGSFPNISIEGLISSFSLYSCRWFLLLLGSPLLVLQCLEFPSGGMELVGEPCNNIGLPCERGKICYLYICARLVIALVSKPSNSHPSFSVSTRKTTRV
jgi:hypothetical protein